MPITIKKRNPISHTMKVAAITIAVFAVVAIMSKLIRDSKPETISNQTSLQTILSEHSALLIPTVKLNILNDAKESDWSKSLSEKIGGKTEVTVKNGRVDVVTDKYAIEVDYLHKWKEGIGQALYYGSQTGLIPVLALISKDTFDQELLNRIESLCTSKGVKVILLVNNS